MTNCEGNEAANGAAPTVMVDAATLVALGKGALYVVPVATQVEYAEDAVIAVNALVSNERQLVKS